jgi:hypothetical protein
MTSPLDRLAGPGKSLTAEPPDAGEFARLKQSGLVRLRDAANLVNSLEGRFDLGYNAAHALCLAALRYQGTAQATDTSSSQVLPHTLGLGPEVWRVLAKCHDLRNRGEYEGDLDVDERIVTDLITACRAVAARLDSLPALPSQSQ